MFSAMELLKDQKIDAPPRRKRKRTSSHRTMLGGSTSTSAAEDQQESDEPHQSLQVQHDGNEQFLRLPKSAPNQRKRRRRRRGCVRDSTTDSHRSTDTTTLVLLPRQQRFHVVSGSWSRMGTLVLAGFFLSLCGPSLGQPAAVANNNNNQERNTTRRPSTAPSWFRDNIVFIPLPMPSDRPTTTVRRPPTTNNSPFLSSPAPSIKPTLAPSLGPTSSDQPSTRPTITPMPSISAEPTHGPSVPPSKPPTVSPTNNPTIAPTVSKQPSLRPSISPTQSPTASTAPSSLPSVSMAPSVSAGPSVIPSVHPSISYRPSHVPSQSPSHIPSSVPSPRPPTQFPTPLLGLRVRRPSLSMTLWGMDRSIVTFERNWAAITSRHVQLYWRSFERDLAYFYVGRVATNLIDEKRIRLTTSQRRKLQGNSTVPIPDPLRVTYSQEIVYDLRENVTIDDLPSYYTGEEELFTLPFEQDGLAYTQALAAELRNNTNIVFLDFIGVVDLSNGVFENKRERNILITIITVVVATVCIACGVIAYLTRLRDPDDVFAPDSPVGAMIGINTTENILVSESYDDEYKSPLSGASRESAKKPSTSEGGTPTGSEPPLLEVQSDSNSPNIAATISDIGSTGDAGENRYRTSAGTDSVYSSPAVASGIETSPFSMGLDEEFHEEESAIHDEDSTGEHSTNLPFMGDFQMEIQDLE